MISDIFSRKQSRGEKKGSPLKQLLKGRQDTFNIQRYSKEDPATDGNASEHSSKQQNVERNAV